MKIVFLTIIGVIYIFHGVGGKGGNGLGSRDICHIYSPDQGNNWYNYKNEKVASASTNKIVDTFTPGIQLKIPDRTWGLMNSQAQVSNRDGIFHVVMYHLKERGSRTVLGEIKKFSLFSLLSG
ncbi:BNR-4 repeat-containing protein [Pedobacter arcticus]|uniref:BNR-4 repeat-containing protein n=1 Tax=Pedobacter arcticus TaxID=752140 RepID=UPI00137554D6|nr:BNR-4 repeat-containing protein [Pedobacter arcticus]